MRALRVPVLVLVLGLASVASYGQGPCSGDAGLAIARAYALAVSYPDNVPQFVAENSHFFLPSGSAIACGQVLVSQLRDAAFSGPSPDEVRAQGIEIGASVGRADLGLIVADDLLESRTDMLLLAGYIESLIVTLPDVAQGNSVPYSQTMLYGLMSFLWPAVGNFMLPQDVALLRHITMQMNEWYVSQFVAAIG